MAGTPELAHPLRHEADAAPVPEAVERGAEQPHLAAAGGHQPEHGADQRRLARAVGAEDGEHLAGAHDEVDAAQHRTATELVVRPGEVLAVLGANGSGKSTLVRTMLGLVPPAAARCGCSAPRSTASGDWRRIGFVPQRAGASSGVPATVREVVAAGRLSRRRPFLPARREDRSAIEDAIDAVGLPRRPATASRRCPAGSSSGC